MGLFNTIESPPCEVCGTKTLGFQFKYGSLGLGYRLGDKLDWFGGPGHATTVPDRKLRYVELDKFPCPGCGAILKGDLLIIRRNILASIYSFPSVIFERGNIGRPKHWRLMLLINQYGADRLVSIDIRSPYATWKGEWSAHLKRMQHQLFGALNSTEAANRWMRRLKVAFSDMNYPQYAAEDVLRNLLAGQREIATGDIINFVQHSFPCPSCGVIREAKIPFLYGPCNGYVYRLGATIDWNKSGHIHEVRDPELHYVEIYLPTCERCGYLGAGMVTTENDSVSDIFIWPKGVLELAEEDCDIVRGSGEERSVTPWHGFEPLDAFLFAREFSVEVFREQLELFHRDSRKYGVSVEELAERAKKEIGWKGF